METQEIPVNTWRAITSDYIGDAVAGTTTPYRHVVYWSRRLHDGRRLTVARIYADQTIDRSLGWRWTIYPLGYRRPGDSIEARGEACTVGAARRAVEQVVGLR